jgi:hypothetical protein
MYPPPCAPAGAAGGIGEPPAAAVRGKRRWSRPMGNLPTSHGFRPFAAGNRAARTRIDIGVDKSTQRHTPRNTGTNATGERHSLGTCVNLPINLQAPSPPLIHGGKCPLSTRFRSTRAAQPVSPIASTASRPVRTSARRLIRDTHTKTSK